MTTPTIWYKTQPAIGTIISGEMLKEYAARKWFKPTLCKVGTASLGTGSFEISSLDLSPIEDAEAWIIGRNSNSGTIMFVQIFTANRLIIETDALPEGSPTLEHHL